nr:MAG TPA: hypothetical protein [Caudoviricetes sp.]
MGVEPAMSYPQHPKCCCYTNSHTWAYTPEKSRTSNPYFRP